MGVALFTVEKAPHAELARQRPVHRFVQQQVARGVGAERAVGSNLLSQFTLDALEIFRVRIDLLGVLQGDALFRVFLVANRKIQITAAAADRLNPRLDRQRQADNGQPVVLFLHYQHRFALISGFWRLGGRAKVHHRNASRHRFVQLASNVAVGMGVEGQEQQQQRSKETRHGSIQ
ncbi:hypothetical protein D3C81_1429890 [compost metagenome]